MSLASTAAAHAPTQAQRWTLWNLALERELAAIALAFRSAGVPLLVLKGVPLTRRLHGGLAGRYSVDNDLLVMRHDVARAAELMQELGYRASEGRRLGDDLTSTFQHPMRRVAHGAILRAELHWQAFPPHLFAVPEELLWRRSVEMAIAGQPLRVFDETMTLLHLASHHVQHRCTEAKVLRDVGAAWDAWHARIDRSELRALSSACGLDDALAFGIDAAHRAGLCEHPAPLHSRRATWLARVMPRSEERARPSYGAILGSLLLAGPGMLPRALYHELLPPLPILARIYGVEASPRLYLRYPLRLLRPVAAVWPRRRNSAANSAQTSSL